MRYERMDKALTQTFSFLLNVVFMGNEKQWKIFTSWQYWWWVFSCKRGRVQKDQDGLDLKSQKKQVSYEKNLKLNQYHAYNCKKYAQDVDFEIWYIKKCFFIWYLHLFCILFLIFAAKFVNQRKNERKMYL